MTRTVVRFSPPRLRLFMALLLSAFMLGSVLHAGHEHDVASSGAHSFCVYCSTFGALADVPVQQFIAPTATPAEDVVLPVAAPFSPILVIVAQPRAPPAC